MPHARRTKRGQRKLSDVIRPSANVWPVDNSCWENLVTEREQQISASGARQTPQPGTGGAAVKQARRGHCL